MDRHPRWLFTALLVSLMAPALGAAPLTLGAGDVLAEARDDGYHLWVRAAAGVESVLLTDAFETPDHRLATYALRSLTPLPLLAGEPRMLDGRFLPANHGSLVSSTKTEVPGFGPAFHLVLPPVVEFGNRDWPNARYGRIDLPQRLAAEGGTFWFSIRLFARPYADYRGAYRDNAYELQAFLRQASRPSNDAYEPGLWEDFSRLGPAYKARDIDDGLNHLWKVLKRPTESLDLVVAIDTTRSMVQALATVRAKVLGPLRAAAGQYRSFRVGLVFYRDYLEAYLARPLLLTDDFDEVQAALDAAEAAGGGDTPEAVVEALWTSVQSFPWSAQERVVVLLGDAPSHPAPRGQVTEAMVRAAAREKQVELQLVLLPQASAAQTRLNAGSGTPAPAPGAP